MVIRPLKRTETECEEVYQVLKSCFRHYQSKISHNPLPSSTAVIYVAEVDGKIVGTVSLTVTKSFSYIDDLAVLEEYRQRGIARQLVEAVMKISEQNSDETYAVCASQWSARICKHLGFRKEDQGRYTKQHLCQ